MYTRDVFFDIVIDQMTIGFDKIIMNKRVMPKLIPEDFEL